MTIFTFTMLRGRISRGKVRTCVTGLMVVIVLGVVLGVVVGALMLVPVLAYFKR